MQNHSTFPVTVAVRRHAKPECFDELEGWAQELCRSARAFPGFLGSEVSVRDQGGDLEIVIGLSFDTSDDLVVWERSEERVRHLEHSDLLTEGPVIGLTVADFGSGLFGEHPGRIVVAPARWKTAAAVWLALFPAAFLLNTFLGPHLHRLPTVLTTLVSTMLLVPFVVWIGVPIVHRCWGRIADRTPSTP